LFSVEFGAQVVRRRVRRCEHVGNVRQSANASSGSELRDPSGASVLDASN
jgi:hypothetical protein